MTKVDQINFDELNCPACADQTMLDARRVQSDALPDGVVIICPTCGFQIAGANPKQVESAMRILWDYPPDSIEEHG